MFYNVNSFSNTYNSYFTEEGIHKAVNQGTYAMIESISSLDEGFTEKMHDDKFAFLGKLLTENNLPHRQMTGCWGGDKTYYSFFVVKSEEGDLKEFRKIIFDLGEQFKQKTVILSTAGHVEEVHTTGKHVNQAEVGEGFNTTIGENYSELSTTDGKSYFIGSFYLDRGTFTDWTV